MNIILTGEHNVGKTALVNEVLDEIDVKSGGITCKAHDDRIIVEDISKQQASTLASKDREEGPDVGEYSVQMDGLNTLARNAIENAILEDELVVIDMVGKMEMHSAEFREAVNEAMRASADVIAVVEKPYVHQFEDIGTVIELNTDNREEVKQRILDLLDGSGADDEGNI
jgi:nucleoside-triphosphatase THEP1